MSNFLAVATVTQALRELIQTAVNATDINADVTTQRPATADGGGASPARVNVYLYQVTPNPHLGNFDLPMRRGDGTLVSQPQVALNLHYLLSFYGDENDSEPERLLGRVVSALHAQPHLSRAHLQQVAGKTGYLKNADLADQVELVKLTPLGLNLEEFSKLWSVFFQTTYTLSIAYAASVVLISGDELPEMAKAVATPWLGAAPLQPGLPALRPNELDALQLWLRADAGVDYDKNALVDTWRDQSGAQHDAFADKPDGRPKLVRNVLNRKPVLRFDGQNDYLAIRKLTYATAGAVQGLTLFALVRSAAAQPQLLLSFDAGEYWSVALRDADGRLSWPTHGPGAGSDHILRSEASFADGRWHLVCARFAAGPAADKQLFVDGKLVATADAYQGAGIGAGKQRFGMIGVGSRAATEGGAIGPADYLRGDLAEVVLFARALASAEQQRIEQYFIEKYT